MVPPGLHFMYWGSGHDTRSGRFLLLKPSEVSFQRWDASLESFQESSGLSEEEQERFTRGFLEFQFDSTTAPYEMSDWPCWQRLSSYITVELLQRCMIAPGTTILPGDPDAEATQDQTSKAIVPHFSGVARTCRFTPLPDGRNPKGLSGEALTLYNLDSSSRLQHLLMNYKEEWLTLFGEYQLAFVLFLLISSLEAFEWWKATTALLCNCEVALQAEPGNFVVFLQVLQAQLEFIPKDFFENALSRDNFLQPALTALVSRILHAQPYSKMPTSSDRKIDEWARLVKAASMLCTYVLRHFNINLGEEGLGEDDLPTVVTSNENSCTDVSAGQVDVSSLPEELERMQWMLLSPETECEDPGDTFKKDVDANINFQVQCPAAEETNSLLELE